jgi:PST family polysaccharide transporter
VPRSFDKYVPKAALKIFSYTAVATFVKMLTGFITLKIIAKIIGTEGVVMLGQLSNFSAIILILACGGISNGVTKYISEHKLMPDKTREYILAAFQITIFFSLFTALALLVLSLFLAKTILMNGHYQYVFIFFSASIIFFSLNSLFLSIINGLQDYKKYVVLNIAGSLLGLLFTVVLVWIWKLPGLLISAVTYQSIVIIATITIIKKENWLKSIQSKIVVNWTIWKQYFKYSLMTLTTAITIPVSQLILRSMIVSKLSVTDAGFWEGINRISGAYMSIFITSFGVYYLPRLSELNEKSLLLKEIKGAYKIVLPIAAILFLFIFLFRKQIIFLLFTNDFLPMQELFFLQLTGDFIKIASWLIGFTMVARAQAKYYIFTETFFALVYVLLSFFLINHFGLIGVMSAYVIMYAIHYTLVIFIFKKIAK